MANVKYVSAGKPKIGGAISAGPVTATLPEDSSSALDESLKQLGYVSEDGLTNSNSAESEKKRAWGGDTVLVISTEKPDTFQFKLIESINVDVLKLVYGEDNVTGDLETGITIKANAEQAEARAYVIDMILTDGVVKRIVIPNAVLSEVGDIEYKDDDMVGFDLTIEALPDKNGNTHYEYIKKAK